VRNSDGWFFPINNFPVGEMQQYNAEKKVSRKQTSAFNKKAPRERGRRERKKSGEEMESDAEMNAL
jgi:hypothetical protein